MEKTNNIHYIKEFFIVFCSSIYSAIILKYFNKVHSGLIIALSLLLFFAIKTAKKYKVFENKFLVFSTVIFSLFLSTIFVLGNKIIFNGDVAGNFIENYIKSLNWIDFIIIPLLCISVFTFLICIFYFINNISNYKCYNNIFEDINPKKMFVLFSVIIFLCWLPYLLVCCPGCVLTDSFNSIYQATGMYKLNNHHPVLFTLIIKIFIKISFLFGHGITFGVFLFVIFQMFVMSNVFGYSLYWMIKNKYNVYFTCFSLVYFALSPVFAIYSFNVQKDVLFSTACFIMVILLVDIVKSNGELLTNNKNIFIFISISFFIAFLRNNGILVVLGLIAVMFIMYYKKLKKFLLCAISFIIFFLIITGPIYKNFSIEKPAVEAFSLPLQQMSRVVVYNGYMTTDEKDFMNSLLPIEKYNKIYTPCLVDTIKWDEDFNTEFLYKNKKLFIKYWIKMFPHNYKEYFKAALMENFGFWKIGAKHTYGFLDTAVKKNYLNIKSTDLINSIFNINIKNTLLKTNFFGSGTLAIIMLISIFFVFVNKKYKYILALLPCFIPWATMLIATPVAFSLRYVFMIAMALPIIISLPFYIINTNKGTISHDNLK